MAPRDLSLTDPIHRRMGIVLNHSGDLLGNEVAMASSQSSIPDQRDHPIIATAEDAITTKFAAIEAGYYNDRFVRPFAARRQSHRPVQVIIKRGTFARVMCVSKMISSFLESVKEEEAQVIVLGAGKDTRYFQLVQGDLARERPSLIRWAEIDHPSVLIDKLNVIKSDEQLFGVTVVDDGANQLPSVRKLKPTNADQTATSSCHLIPFDLRKDPSMLCDLLRRSGFQSEIPTIFVSECVFMYLPKTATERLLQSMSQAFSRSCICLYEPILGSGAFGRMMQDNLTRAGVARPDTCLLRTRSIDDYASMILPYFSRMVGCDMYSAYETILTLEQRTTANRCEFLDELEEFMLIMKVYCIAVATVGGFPAGEKLCQVDGGSKTGLTKGHCLEFTS